MTKKSKLIIQSKLLERQKPKKKIRFYKYRFIKKYLFFASCTASIIVIGYALKGEFKNDRLMFYSLVKSTPSPITIDIFPNSTKEDHALLIRKSFKNIEMFSRDEIKSRLLQIQSMLSAKSINIIKTNSDRYAILIENHIPLFAVELDRPRLVNQEGQAFGHYQKSVHQSLPLLKGIRLSHKPTILSDQTLKISTAAQATIDEALLLIHSSLRYNITYKDLEFDEYRGFRAILSDNDISVELGRDPFDKRLNRLRKIIDNLRKDGKFKAHIELDFNGKAFVRELGT